MGNKGVNLVELVVVTIILGILVTIAIPAYMKAQERSLDKDATSTLFLIRSAEIMYNMDNSAYYPASGASVDTTSNLSAINTNLRLTLSSYLPKWKYTRANGSGTAVTVSISALRLKTGGRTWSITVANETPGCANGASDTCLP